MGRRSCFVTSIAGFIAVAVLFVGRVAVAGGREAPSSAEAAVAGTALPSPLEVVTGIYFDDIHEFDFRTHSYAVDFYVWYRWRNKDINSAKTMEFMNRSAPDNHVRDMLYDKPMELPGGNFFAIVRN